VLLDFAAPGSGSRPRDASDTDAAGGDRLAAAQRFLARVMSSALAGASDVSTIRGEETGSRGQPLPLHARRLLDRLEAADFERCDGLLAALAECERRAPALTRRRRLMQLAPLSLAVAFVWSVAMGIYGLFVSATPADVMTVRGCVSEILRLAAEGQEAGGPDAAGRERIAALEILLAGPLRAAAEDSTISFAGQTLDPVGRSRRGEIRRILAERPAPTEAQVEAANRALAPFLREVEAGQGAGRHVEVALTVLGAFLHLVAPLAVVLGLLTRGGPMLGLAEIAVVMPSGAPVSRARALLRSMATWSPFVVLWGATLPVHGIEGWDASWMPVVLAVFLAGAVYAVVSPSRGVQDRLARTYLVPR
jgi:hypothetical protein